MNALRRMRCKARSVRARLGLFTRRTIWDGHCWGSDSEVDYFAAPSVPVYRVKCVDCGTVEEDEMVA